MMAALQRAAGEWHASTYPDATPPWVIVKATEELGEFARAVGGENEGRAGRGDPGDELVDTIVVLLSYAGRFLPDRDVLREARLRLTTMPGVNWIARAEQQTAPIFPTKNNRPKGETKNGYHHQEARRQGTRQARHQEAVHQRSPQG